MTTRTRTILGWTPHILVALFLILASGAPKLFMSGEGSALQPFATALGVWEILFWVGLLEVAVAVLLLIPRTTTIGFILMTGLLGGAAATGLTHPEVEDAWPWFPIVLLLIVTAGSYVRSPELLDRLLKRPVPAVSKAGRILGWILVTPLSLFFAFSTASKFMTHEPGSIADQFAIDVGMRGLEYPLGILQILILVLFLIPRTSTVGFVLMVGYWAGILAAHLSHGFYATADNIAIYIGMALLTLSAWFRNRELLTRLLGRGA